MSLASDIKDVNPYDAEEWFFKNLPELDNATLKLLYSKLNTSEDLENFLAYLHFKNAPKQSRNLPQIVAPKPTPPPIQTRPRLIKFSDDPVENFKQVLDIPNTNLSKEFDKDPEYWTSLVKMSDYSKLYDALEKLDAPVVYYEADENVRTPNKDKDVVFIILNDTPTDRGIYRYRGLLSRIPGDFDFNVVKEKA